MPVPQSSGPVGFGSRSLTSLHFDDLFKGPVPTDGHIPGEGLLVNWRVGGAVGPVPSGTGAACCGDSRWLAVPWTPCLCCHPLVIASRDTGGVYMGICLHCLFFLFLNEVSKSVSTAEQQLWKKSFSCFEKGIHNFESIGDATNAALLLCNTGRLMRICAQAHCGAGDEFKREFSPEEGLYYNKVMRLLACWTSPIRTSWSFAFAALK